MKIIVAIKQVPVRDSALRIDSSGKWIDEDDLSYEINEPDAYALEEALQLKEKHGGEVIAVLAGPEGAEAALGFLGPVDRHLQLTAMRRALAMAGAMAGA